MTATIPNVVGVITPEQRTPDWFRVLIHGPQGSGKTTLASTIADLGPTLFLDLVGEKGTRSYQGTPWEKNITPPGRTARRRWTTPTGGWPVATTRSRRWSWTA